LRERTSNNKEEILTPITTTKTKFWLCIGRKMG